MVAPSIDQHLMNGFFSAHGLLGALDRSRLVIRFRVRLGTWSVRSLIRSNAIRDGRNGSVPDSSPLGDYSGPMAFEHDMGAVRRCVMQVGLVLVCDSPAFPISNRDGMR